MNNGGEAAEQIVRLSLEGFEVAAKLTGSAAKEMAILLASALKETGKTQGKARLSSMIRTGKPLKVFSLPQKDVRKFCQHAKQYGVLYCVLRDKFSNSPDAVIDIIAREEDGSKIQRIIDRFQLAHVDKASIVTEVQRALEKRSEQEPSHGDVIVAEAMGQDLKNPIQAAESPVPLSAKGSAVSEAMATDGRESVRKKLEGFKTHAPVKPEEPEKAQGKQKMLYHKHPKRKKKKSKNKTIGR